MSTPIEKGCITSNEDEVYLSLIMNQRWPKQRLKCSGCGKMRIHIRVRGRTSYACPDCRQQVYPLAGTIFEKSTTRLGLWFRAHNLLRLNHRITAKEMKSELGVTYKTAWRIRTSLHDLSEWTYPDPFDCTRDRNDKQLIAASVRRFESRGPKAIPDRARILRNNSADTSHTISPSGPSPDPAKQKRATAGRKYINASSVREFAKLGFSVAEIAKSLNCDRSALRRYYQPEIDEGRRRVDIFDSLGSRPADLDSLFNKATLKL